MELYSDNAMAVRVPQRAVMYGRLLGYFSCIIKYIFIANKTHTEKGTSIDYI